MPDEDAPDGDDLADTPNAGLIVRALNVGLARSAALRATTRLGRAEERPPGAARPRTPHRPATPS
ncbi:hypothetical protein OG399_39965 [Streptomyces achromogenes]|uniref:Uncharacterized protein n=1 Tax=Streptomyces achromogenes TaxID=67255 RepID=A0ABZ1KYG0_STRAH